MDGARDVDISEIADSILTRASSFLYRCRNDANYSMIRMAGAVEALSGLPSSAFLGDRPQSYAGIILAEDRDKVFAAVDQALEARAQWTVRYRLVRSDGALQWVHECGGGVFDPDGTLMFLEGIVIDHAATATAEAETVARQKAVEERCQSLLAETVPVLTVLRLLKILSLNARIEAARTGLAGAGFAVVADEIGKIAEETGERAERIAQLAAQLQGLLTAE
jgi:hypothetical protein